MEDPHGTRGSTERHALDYKGDVKAFSSADILASFSAFNSQATQRSSVPASKRNEGNVPHVTAKPAAAPPATPTFHALDFKGEVRVRDAPADCTGIGSSHANL